MQNLKYQATFPLLLNIADEPTYFIALKDDAGLVKKYAMVNVQKYQVVAIGDTVSQCQESYRELLVSNGIRAEEEGGAGGEADGLRRDRKGSPRRWWTATPTTMSLLEGSEEIFDVPVADCLEIIRYEAGGHRHLYV